MFAVLKTATVSLLCSLVLLSGSVTAATVTTTTETWSFKTGQTTFDSPNRTIELKSNLQNTAILSGWSTRSSSGSATIRRAQELTLSLEWGTQLWKNNNDHHSVDNDWGFDFILLEFPSPIQLASITNTWQGNNSNLSIAAFKNTFITSNLNTLTLIELAESAIFKASYLNTGAHYSFASNNSLTPSDISQVSSQYWLIGAYNAVFNSANCSKNCPITVNGLKFGSITTTKTTTTPTPTPVPTPGTLSLFAVALLGLSLHKRRKAK